MGSHLFVCFLLVFFGVCVGGGGAKKDKWMLNRGDLKYRLDCSYQNFVPWELSALAPRLYTCMKLCNF